jgi:hypothetical protein
VTAPSTPAPSSPTPRRIAAPRWLDLRLILGVGLVLVAVLVGAVVFSRAGRTTGVVAARHDLAAGTVLTADDLTVVQVKLPNRGVYLDTAGPAVGKRLQRAVSSGELLPRDAVAAAGPHTTLTVPFAAGSAPDLRTGQRIEVWVSTSACTSEVLLSDVTVQSAHRDSSGAFDNGGDGQDVVISVEPDLAQRVIGALAIDGVRLRAGVLDGGSSPSSAAPLPDLSSCAAPSAGR